MTSVLACRPEASLSCFGDCPQEASPSSLFQKAVCWKQGHARGQQGAHCGHARNGLVLGVLVGRWLHFGHGAVAHLQDKDSVQIMLSVFPIAQRALICSTSGGEYINVC